MFKMFHKTHIQNHHTRDQKEKEDNIMMKVMKVIHEVRKCPRKLQKRKIVYEEDIDGIPYEPDSPTEEEDQEDDI